ncbi:MAG TPA: SDR family NAD(P)-dependent oxidoreductase, partial [Acidobacteriota bacterium]|nr:SDR family NAD(P)-dependent oxidoreductase [Acidobacteriota bacterium]
RNPANQDAPPDPAVLPSLHRGQPERLTMLRSLAHLYCLGLEVDWRQASPRGRFIPLPRYPFQRRRFWMEPPQSQPTPKLFREDGAADAETRDAVSSLVNRWASDGALAVNRRHLAPWVFLGSQREALFFCDQRSGSLTALLYVGPEEGYGTLARELRSHCSQAGLNLNLVADQTQADVLSQMGLTTTPCGVLQKLTDLQHFSLRGNRMRRLRYWVNRYASKNECSLEEYDHAHGDGHDVITLIDRWTRLKGEEPEFVPALRQELRQGALDPRQRIFLTRRGEEVDCAIFLSPAYAEKGFLMDLEFYGESSPRGCLEYSIVEIIGQLGREGHSYLSLGGTFGTGLEAHPEQDPEAADLLATLHDQGTLNGDSNRQFKSKFRPQTSPLYLCRPEGGGDLAAVLMMLAGRGQADEAQQQSQRGGVLDADKPHPLLRSEGDGTFRAELPEYFSQHHLQGRPLLPGAAHLEMALAAGRALLGESLNVVSDFTIQQPLYLEPPPASRVRVQRVGAMGCPECEISSRSGQSWTSHSAARLHAEEAAPQAANDSLNEVRRRCSRPGPPVSDFYGWLKRLGYGYEENFQCVQQLWEGTGEVIGKVSLSAGLRAQAPRHLMHPVLLDGCFQLAAAAARQAAGFEEIFLMRGIERVAFYDRLTPEIWAWVKIRESAEDGSLFADLKVFDPEGRVLAEIGGLEARRFHTGVLPKGTDQGKLFQLGWRPRGAVSSLQGVQGGSWLILSDQGGVGRELCRLLRSQGGECWEALPGESWQAESAERFRIRPQRPRDYRRLLRRWLREASGAPQGVVHLWSLDAEPDPRADDEAMEQACRRSCGTLLHALQALLRTSPAGPAPRLWTATRGGQAADDAGVADPAQTALWGLAQVAAGEHPGCWGGLVDLETSPVREQARVLAAEVKAEPGRPPVAYRGGRRLAARLEEVSPAARQGESLHFRSRASYLISGGLGGIGLQVAQWLARQGAGRILLLSRRPVGEHPQAAEAIRNMEAEGARVEVLQADAADSGQLAAALSRAKDPRRPLRGVIHAAGVVDDRVLLRQDWETFRKVLAPKVRGGWNLHRLTEDTPLDFFLLFSSAAAWLGPQGQSNHATASAFLDGLAHYRRSRGLPATVINWGAWGGGGLPEQPQVRERLRRSGVVLLDPQEALDGLEAAMHSTAPQIGVLRMDWSAFTASNPASRPLVEHLAGRKSRPRPPRAASDGSHPRNHAAPNGAQPSPPHLNGADGHNVEDYLRQQASQVLGLDPSGLDLGQPLADLGFDSLMSIELRNRIESDLGVRVPIVHFFRRPAIADLAERIQEHSNQGGPPPPTRQGEAQAGSPR